MKRQIFFAALLALPASAVASITGEPPRCSLRLAPGTRSATATVLLATGRADTVLAGPGQLVLDSLGGGHSGPGRPGPIHGQVFDVELFAGPDSALLARTFELAGHRRALIVPWDYGASCDPTRWSSGAAWVPVGRAGTFTLELRPDSLTVDGLPVFDAFVAAFEPYPLSPAYRDARRTPPQFRTDSELNAEQYFELLAAMPTHEDRRERPDSAWAMLLRWQAEHPGLVEMYPANQVATDLATDVSRVKARNALREIQPVIAGTYRMSFSLDGRPEQYFYLRTRQRPLDEWRPGSPLPLPGPTEEPRRPNAYNMLASGAASLEALAVDCAATRTSAREGYMYVIDPPPVAGDVRTEWAGWLEVNLIARQFPGDAALAAFRQQAFDEWAARRRSVGDLDAPAVFWLDADGVLRVEQTIRVRDGRTLSVRGQRISRVEISCEA